MTGLAANFLNVKPMIHFAGGEIFSGGMARGRQKSMEKAIEQLLGYLAERKADPTTTASSPGTATMPTRAAASGMQLRAALRARYPASECDAGLLQIGATIRASTPGPTPWAWASCANGKRKHDKRVKNTGICLQSASLLVYLL